MIQESVERQSEFRFPVVVPVEYFAPDGSGILSYALDLSKNGSFISSDNHPLGIGTRLDVNLNVPVDQETSRILRTEGIVVWNRMLPFKSKRNGMGVQFIRPLPEGLLLNALVGSTKRLTREAEAKRVLGERVEKLESELETARRLVALGRCAEKILLELSNPILTLSAKLETVKKQMHEHKEMLEGHERTNKEEFKKIVTGFDASCRNIDKILKDYKIISELPHMVGDDGQTLERKLKKRYK